MSIRERLADALQTHLVCDDGQWAENMDETCIHLADVLLSLPGIAIVDTSTDLDWVAEQMAKADDVIYGLLTPEEAEFYRRLARAALQAAAEIAGKTP